MSYGLADNGLICLDIQVRDLGSVVVLASQMRIWRTRNVAESTNRLGNAVGTALGYNSQREAHDRSRSRVFEFDACSSTGDEPSFLLNGGWSKVNQHLSVQWSTEMKTA